MHRPGGAMHTSTVLQEPRRCARRRLFVPHRSWFARFPGVIPIRDALRRPFGSVRPVTRNRSPRIDVAYVTPKVRRSRSNRPGNAQAGRLLRLRPKGVKSVRLPRRLPRSVQAVRLPGSAPNRQGRRPAPKFVRRLNGPSPRWHRSSGSGSPNASGPLTRSPLPCGLRRKSGVITECATKIATGTRAVTAIPTVGDAAGDSCFFFGLQEPA